MGSKLIFLIMLVFCIGLVSAGTITFNDEYTNIFNAYYYNYTADTYTALGANGANIVYFPDDAGINDSLAIANYKSASDGYGKFNELKFNVSTNLSATSISLVWEYARKGVGYYNTNWYNLSDVIDDTNSFQNTGVNTVNWSIPEDWENYFNPNGEAAWYSYYIRARIVSVSGLTEGGHQDANTNIFSKPYVIYVSGYSESNPANFTEIYEADVTNGWGVVNKNNNQFTFNCSLFLKSGSYLETTQEQIQFLKNWDIFILGVIKSGLVYSGSKVYRGSEFTFNLYNGDLGGYIAYTDAEIYNTHYRYVHMPGSSIMHGHWGGGLGTYGGQKIIDIYAEGLRQFSFARQDNVIIGATGQGMHVETPGAILKDITTFGAGHSVRPTTANIGHYMHQSDFSGATSAPINPYLCSTNNFLMYFVDCNWGTFDDAHQALWSSPGTNNSFYKTNSVLMRSINEDGDGIETANLTIDDSQGDSFSYLSNVDGYFGQDFGNITSATASTMNDSSKSWSSNQWWFKEVYITSGKGIGQRRIIKKGNTGVQLQVAPDWDTTPNETSKYMIIPYINTELVEPITPGATSYSIVTDLNPFLIEITHDDYHTNTFNLTINKLTDMAVKLDEKPAWNYSIAPLWLIRNKSTSGVFKISPTGDLAIAGELYENTNSPPTNEILWNFRDLIWIMRNGDVYIKGVRVW